MSPDLGRSRWRGRVDGTVLKRDGFSKQRRTSAARCGRCDTIPQRLGGLTMNLGKLLFSFLGKLLFSFGGRINRAKFWLGWFIVTVYFTVGFFVALIAGRRFQTEAIVPAALAAIALVPAVIAGIAISIKR